MYSLKKFHTYNFTLQRIGEQFKREYVQRISQEFKRAKENGELKQGAFYPVEWDDMMLLIQDPDAYYFKICLKISRSVSGKESSIIGEFHNYEGWACNHVYYR